MSYIFGPYDTERGDPSYGNHSIGIGGKDHPKNSVTYYKTAISDAIDDRDSYQIIYKDKLPVEVMLKYVIKREDGFTNVDDELTLHEKSIKRIKLLQKLIQFERDFIGEEAFNRVAS